ncbi:MULTISPECIES: hypothetical protein [unclassified Streptomyces]|uniref:hypothetical protein n=1 Tax=unclassified Streptomyces TaxID=2593676 RepID=UPI003413B745
MPRSDQGSDNESFTTAESGGSTIAYTAAVGSSTFQPVTTTPPPGRVTPPGVSASPEAVTASPAVSLAATPPASPPPPVPATDPPLQNPVGVFDVEAQTFLAADAQKSAVYRWSQNAQEWLGENREHIKRFAFEAVPLVLQAAGKGADNNHLNMAGVGLAGVKNAAYMVQAGVNYYNTGEKAYLAQGVAAAVGIGGAVASGYGNDTTLPQSSQNNWQSAGAALQAGSASWSYSSPTAQQTPAPTTSAAGSRTTVNPTSVPAPTAPTSSSSSSLPADQQQSPILPAGRAVVGRQDSVATGVSTSSTTSRPAVVRRTTTMVQRTNSTNGANGTNGAGRARGNS